MPTPVLSVVQTGFPCFAEKKLSVTGVLLHHSYLPSYHLDIAYNPAQKDCFAVTLCSSVGKIYTLFYSLASVLS